MEEIFDQESVNPKSAIRFAECITDLSRLIMKMQDYGVRFLITQQAEYSGEIDLKVQTKLSLKSNDSYDEVDVVVSEQAFDDDDDDIPFIRNQTNLCEFMRCYVAQHYFTGSRLNTDLSIREVAGFQDNGFMDKLDHLQKEIEKYKRQRIKELEEKMPSNDDDDEEEDDFE